MDYVFNYVTMFFVLKILTVWMAFAIKFKLPVPSMPNVRMEKFATLEAVSTLAQLCIVLLTNTAKMENVFLGVIHVKMLNASLENAQMVDAQSTYAEEFHVSHINIAKMENVFMELLKKLTLVRTLSVPMVSVLMVDAP